MRSLTPPLLLALLLAMPAGVSAACLPGRDAGSCALQIRIATAKYGSEDQWCSGLGWVSSQCNGRWICPVALPEVAGDRFDAAERSRMRRETICGPVSAAAKSLSIGWYCSDGVTFLGQPTVTLRDGELAMLSCSAP
ncbi:hypothetical protein T8K17_15695 [Thalassobaculum sp. OXR-137]|uniref:hypothetical protein n=1 Tax=Thalassobaculum sp. OXR-137 TaxID=3100173 RepID=UPI002AC981D2|nr:hypothetical protein [Thalassobaculum sp. OXR-137]WPZ32683.1 hypothetical protein T8K17_15695 [Thalassobaculum sp. OXR-137]